MNDIYVWKSSYEHNKERFIDSLCSAIDKKEFKEASLAIEIIHKEFSHAITYNIQSQKEKLLDIVQEIYPSFDFMGEASPGFYVLKGKIEIIKSVLKSIFEHVPDTELKLEISMLSKYANKILEFLTYQNNTTTTKIAHYLGIPGPQLTLILDKLEEKDYISRVRDGKYKLVKLTTKGLQVGRAAAREESNYDLIQLLTALKSKNEKEIIRRIEFFKKEHSDQEKLIHLLEEIHHDRIFTERLIPTRKFSSNGIKPNGHSVFKGLVNGNTNKQVRNYEFLI